MRISSHILLKIIIFIDQKMNLKILKIKDQFFVLKEQKKMKNLHTTVINIG